MHVRLWVNGFKILSQELQGLLSCTKSTLILWGQLMELLKRYGEDIPEVDLEIVLKSAKIAELRVHNVVQCLFNIQMAYHMIEIYLNIK